MHVQVLLDPSLADALGQHARSVLQRPPDKHLPGALPGPLRDRLHRRVLQQLGARRPPQHALAIRGPQGGVGRHVDAPLGAPLDEPVVAPEGVSLHLVYGGPYGALRQEGFELFRGEVGHADALDQPLPHAVL